MAENLNDKLRRLQEAKKKAEEFSQKRQRLAGERDSHQKRLAELEKKCSDDYGCDIGELPGLISQLEKEVEESIVQAEKILTTPGSTSDGKEETPVTSKLNVMKKVSPTSIHKKPRIDDEETL